MPLLTATDLQGWSATRHAQAHLPTLVRRLVLATVVPTRIHFPAAEGVSTPGFDGVVETAVGAPPFVPAGRSTWELGTGASKGGPAAKAEADFSKRTRTTSDEERAATTYVFVTSRPWSRAAEWAREKAQDGWAGVVALDAQDLAAWLALCPGVHGWLEEEAFGRRPHGIEGLRDWYRRWAERTEPPIPAQLLLAGRDDDAAELVGALTGAAGERLLTAGAQEEALAFAAAALITEPPTQAGDATTATGDTAVGGAGEPGSAQPGGGALSHAAAVGDVSAATREALLERALVVHDEAAWRQWTVHESPLVLLPSFPEPDVDGALRRGHHVVLTRAARPADRALAPLRRDRAREVWERAGIPFPQADELARAAGRSLTSLRRRIGRAGRFRRPSWADGPAANLLAPLLLAGAWRDDVPGDRDVVVELADRNAWRGVARDLAPLAAGEDAPVVQYEHRWEFVDILDAWVELRGALTAEDLDVFQERALEVLGEPDPAAGLASDERRRRALTVEGGLPRRSRSEALRRGMATTLAVLGSVVGDQTLPGARTGQDRASRAVRSLLQDADGERWTSLADLLPLLAEASPDAFLDAVERSVEQPDPPVMALFAEADDPFGLTPASRHSTLLWALEALAFSPRYLSRAAVALARLARLDPGGRLANRPADSLAAVLHPVLPQGATDEAGRMAVVDAVRRAAPEAGWSLMLSLVTSTDGGMHIRRGPRFREWRREAPAPTYGDVARTLTALAERVAQDAAAGQGRWGAALSVVDKVPPAGREAILGAAGLGLPALPDGDRRTALAALAERVERHARFRDAAWALDDETVSRLQAFLAEHAVPGEAPDDHGLFTWWPRRSGLDPGTEQGQAALAAARREAVTRALSDGPASLRRLAESAELPETVGDTVARLTAEYDDELLAGLAQDGSKAQRLAHGLVRVRQADKGWLRQTVVDSPQIAVELLLAADVDDDLLRLLDGTDPDVRDQYWRRVPPRRVPDALAASVAEALLAHDRPFSAMHVLHDAARDGALPVDLTVRAMTAPAAGTAESLEAIHSPQYVVGELLGALERAGTSSDVLAQIEWLYLPLLRYERAPEALHRRLAAEPALFAEIVCAVYRRRVDDEDDTEDEGAAGTGTAGDGPADEPAMKSERGPGEDVAPHVAAAAWALLHGWRAPLPGSAGGQPPTGDQVSQWVREAKRLLAAAGRGEIASVVIGEALSGPADDSDGTWPSLPVRDTLEAEQDRGLEEGLAIGRINQRGVTVRGPYDGGAQERRLEAQYRRWADVVRERWPRSGALLDSLADGYAADARREDESAARDR